MCLHLKQKTSINSTANDTLNDLIIFQSLNPPDLDPKLTITKFDRTEEQNEELGLNDMKVDEYE